MLHIVPGEVPVARLHSLLLGAVGPRPIALASTVDAEGRRNLSPFSFFNVFSANPPIAVFSPARRGKDGTSKHTYENMKEVPEVVINVVTYDMVQQVSLASTEYGKGVDEFIKSGLTPLESVKVKPARVAESPVQMECVVRDIVELGSGGGAGNLVIAEIVLMHVSESIIDGNGSIDQVKIDQVARMGGNWYTRANLGLFEVEKPIARLGIGVDGIPEEIRQSTILSGNDFGMLGNVESLPEKAEIAAYKKEFLSKLFSESSPAELTNSLHREAKRKLTEKKVEEAWKILLSGKS